MCLGCLVTAGAVVAQDKESDFNRFRLHAGGFFLEFDTETKVSSRILGPGSTIDLEDDLAVDSDETELFIGGQYRFNRRHSIGLSYLDIERGGQALLQRDIQFGDRIFTIGANTVSTFDYRVLEINYRYRFLSREKFEAMIGAGLSLIDFDLALTAVPASGAPVVIEQREDEQYPVPTITLAGSYRLADEWCLRGALAYFDYSADDWDTSMLVGSIAVEYFPWQHFGFGLSYNQADIEYDEEGDDPFDIDYEYEGFIVRLITEF